MDMFDLHRKMTAHLFPTFGKEDERFLAIALCGEVGELANMIKKRWRDGVDLGEEIRDEIADIRIYLELIAKCFDIDGSKMELHTILAGTVNTNSLFRDERFLSLVLCSRAGGLATTVETRWNSGYDVMASTAREQITYIRIYLQMMADLFLLDGDRLDHRVVSKLAKVVRKHGIALE